MSALPSLTGLYWEVLYGTVWCGTACYVHRTVLCRTVLCCTVLYLTVGTALFCTVLFCTVRYGDVPHSHPHGTTAPRPSRTFPPSPTIKRSAVYPYTYTCLKRGLGGSVREGRREGRAHVGGECGVSVCASVRCCVRVDQGAGVSTGERETVCFRPTRIGPIIKSNPVRRINTCIPNRAATVCPVAGARAAWGSFLFPTTIPINHLQVVPQAELPLPHPLRRAQTARRMGSGIPGFAVRPAPCNVSKLPD